jgi:Domain of unknown function (DUF4833)
MCRPLRVFQLSCLFATFSAAAVSLVLVAAAPSTASEFSSTVTELDRLPRVRPDFPLPTDPNLLFYVQNSTGPNTVVYAARLDAAGRINQAEPIDVFWRRFTRGGIRVPLSFFERMFVYGVTARSSAGQQDAIAANVVSYPQRPITVDLDNEGRPRALIPMGGRSAKLAYVYVEIDESKIVPSIIHADVFGVDVASGHILHELIKPVQSQN